MTSIVVVIFVIVATATLARLLDRSEARKAARLRTLLDAWKQARQEREDWLKDYPYFKNPFVYPEYEELWQREIGAEALFEIFCNTGSANSPSFREYAQERKHFENLSA